MSHRKELEMYSNLDMAAIEKATYLFDFDRAVQCVVPLCVCSGDGLIGCCRCPTWGYPTEDAYYRDASSADSVLSIRIPFMAIHATDDPVW